MGCWCISKSTRRRILENRFLPGVSDDNVHVPIRTEEEMRRRRRQRLLRREQSKFLQEAGVYMPVVAGEDDDDILFYVMQVTVEDYVIFNRMAVDRQRLVRDGGILVGKANGWVLYMAMLSVTLFILSYLKNKYPVVTSLLEATANGTTLLSRHDHFWPIVGSGLMCCHIYGKLIYGSVYAKWRTIEVNHATLIQRMNDERRRLPLVAHTEHDDDEATMGREHILNTICSDVVMPVSLSSRCFWGYCVVVLLWGLFNCYAMILFSN